MAEDGAKPDPPAPEPGHGAALRLAEDAASPPNRAAPPKRLGGFELLGRLGKGGMGTVLKARQVSMDRLVALKILPRKLAESEQFVQRFLREARSAARLRHPNIVQAFDVGQIDGHYFFAMEFVDGETLSDIIGRGGPLEQERALAVMKQVASALAAAHDAGVIHRDIKPSNIMLDREGQIRVTDFGLAKRADGDVTVTADGTVVGTPAYVAPEMAKGFEADARSDLCSLGATIFHALAGRPPFEGRNFSEVLVKQATEPAPPLATLAPRVDRRLCYIIDRLLRKEPDARYPSAKALLDDLEGLGRLQSVVAAARAEGRAMIAEAPTLEMTEGQRLAREVTAEARLSGQRPRSRRTALAAAAVLLVVISGLVAIRLRSDRTHQPTVVPPSTPTPSGTKLVAPPETTPKVPPMVPKAVTTEVPVAKKEPPVEPKQPTPAVPPALRPAEWVALFDGKSLDGWRVLEGESFKDHGEVHVQDGVLRMDLGPGPRPITAIVYTGTFPTDNYEVEIEAMRTGGNLDFGCLTFPVGGQICSLIIGGSVHGDLLGFRNIDGRDPWDHPTGHKWFKFKSGVWYRVRLRVASDALTVWLGDEQQFAMPRAGHRFESFWVLAEAKPFGVVTYITGGAIRSLRVRALDPGPPPGAKPADWAKWTDIKSRARALARAGQLGDAQKLLATAKGLAIGDGDALIAEQTAALAAARKPPAAERGDWAELFDGKSLRGWRVLEDGLFKDHGAVAAVEGELRILQGRGAGPTTAIAYTGTFPRDNYEVEIEARRIDGTLDFADLVFPVGDQTCTLLVGAHTRGNLIGLRSVDRQDPWQHDGHKLAWFRNFTWYRVRLRVAPDELAVWLNDEEQFTLPRAGHRFESSWVLDDSKPFGVVAYMAGSAIRSLRVRSLDPGPPPGVKPAEWAKWTDIRSRARELARAGQYDEAARLVLTGQTVPNAAIGELVDRELAAVDVARRQAAYVKESEKVWALFQERRYREADKLLATLAAKLAPEAAEPIAVHDMVMADLGAATLLRNYWLAVERGLALKGGTISLDGVTGQFVSVEKGVITIQAGKGTVARRVQELEPMWSLFYAQEARKTGGYSELAEDVFRIAEAGEPTVADKLRITLGKPLGMGAHRKSLPYGAEFFARQAWREIEASANAKLSKAEAERLIALLKAFEDARADTKYFASVRDKLPDLRAQIQACITTVIAKPPRTPVWGSLFDGKSLNGWEAARGGHFLGNVADRLSVAEGSIAIGASPEGTGVRCAQDIPTTDYELTFEANAIEGSKWAGSALFPLGGGAGLWEIRTGEGGPTLLARSAAEGLKDIRSQPFAMANGTWYRFRLRVDAERVQAWINDQQVFDCPRRGYDFGFWPGWVGARPLGFFTGSGAKAKIRNIRIQALAPQAGGR